MGFGSNNGWLIDFNRRNDEQATDLIWTNQISCDPKVSSISFQLDVQLREDKSSENSKKRNLGESYAEPGSKACREKMRRDKLNMRFLELHSVLDPGGSLKTDKIIILNETTHRVKQLRTESENLRKANKALQQKLKSLKAEKVELRDQKIRLKAERERLHQIVKDMTTTPSSFIQPYLISTESSKTNAYPNYPPIEKWQWLPLASLDTSQDHVLWSPVA